MNGIMSAGTAIKIIAHIDSERKAGRPVNSLVYRQAQAALRRDMAR